MTEKKIRIVLAIAAFGVSLITYLLTVAPTVSFWDCGEFIACANIMGIPHPPGTPFFMIMGRAFIVLFGFFSDVAYRINLLSVLSSAGAVACTFLFTEKLLSLILTEKRTTFITATGGMVAAFLLTFSDTFWFNAVEAEVYGIAMFIVMLISWLSLLWVDEMDTGKGERFLLLICYLAFLGIGFHLYTVMTIPAILVLMLLIYPKSRVNFPLWVTGTGLMSVIYKAGSFVYIALALLVIMGAGYLISQDKAWKKRWSLSMWFCIIALIGYSTHAYIPIRSALDPRIDENNPEIPLTKIFDRSAWSTYESFVERKQYGSESMLERAFHRRGSVWNQVFTHPHMGYGGYMLAQYLPWKVGAGRSEIVDNKYLGKAAFTPEENDPVRILGMDFKSQSEVIPPYTKRNWQVFWFVLFHIPMLWGGIMAYKRNRNFGIYILLLYFMASAGLIFYMNFSDGIRPDMGPYKQWVSQGANISAPPQNVYMEVRERDYFYAPSYMFMSVLFGLSAAFLLVRLRERQKSNDGSIVKGTGIALMVVSFIVPAISNYEVHNRSKVWVPFDYAKNLLESCRPNSILFTNGDNDTFPLWFMQEAMNVRKDVRVVNLSLANTNWYIRQLIEQEPKVILGYTADQIDALEYQMNPSKSSVDYKLGKTGLSVTLEGNDKKPYYKVQDLMVMTIVQNNYPKRPVHFAITVSDPNMMGLEKYMEMEGMVYTLTNDLKHKEINVERSAHLADSVYVYRGLSDTTVFLNNDTRGLLSNYFMINHQLSMWALRKITALDAEISRLESDPSIDSTSEGGDSLSTVLEAKKTERVERIAFGNKYLDKSSQILWWDWRHFYYSSAFYRGLKDYVKTEEMLLKGKNLGKQTMRFDMQLAEVYLEWNKFDKAIPIYNSLKKQIPEEFRIWFALSDAYEKQGKFSDAKSTLSEWLEGNPQHQYSGFVTQRISELEKKSTPLVVPVVADSAADSTGAAEQSSAGVVENLTITQDSQ